MRPRRERVVLLAMRYKSGKKNIVVVTSRITTSSAARSLIAVTPKCTTCYFYHRSLPPLRINNTRVLTVSSRHWIYFTLLHVCVPSLAFENCENRRWSKVCATRIYKIRDREYIN